MFVCIRSLLHSVRFGQLLRCAHKRIVTIMKEYIERKNMQVQLIPFSKKYRLYDVGKFEVGNFRERRVYEIGFIAIRDVSPLFCAGQSHG